MNELFIIESNGGSDGFGWYPVSMYNTPEMAARAIRPLLKRWPSAYRIVRYRVAAEQITPIVYPVTGEKVYRALVAELDHPCGYITKDCDLSSVTVDGEINCESIAEFLNR